MDDPRPHALPLDRPEDLAPLLARIGDARFVLLGEASHGTAEYYRWRATITRRLIADHGFHFVAVEGDWPDCQQIDSAVRRASPSVDEALARFERWPTWMWANREVADFAHWLRDVNADRAEADRVGFHGLDVYSLWESLRATMEYLEEHEPDLVDAARSAFRCFEPYREDPQEYAWATRYMSDTCERAVVQLLTELCGQRQRDSSDGSEGGVDARFDAEQNAAAAAGAERYYRAMVRSGSESWNVRDVHMADTLDRLADRYGPQSRGVVWEHNTHIGDARFTDMARAGMVNVGQLMRERHGEDNVVLVGFAGYRGTVVAADAWGGEAEVMDVPAAREGSVEARLHDAGVGQSLFVFDDADSWAAGWQDHRAIGVVYHPGRERLGNYVPTVLSRRYDALLFFPETEALQPIKREARDADAEQAAFPSGL